MKMKPDLIKWLLILCLGFVSCHQNTRQINLDSGTDTIKYGNSKDENNDTAARKKPATTDQLIIPGESIGKTRLGTNADSLESILGLPDVSDAAMGKAWLTWKGKRNASNNSTQLNVYTTYNDNTMQQKTVQQIRTTSSYFSTLTGIQVSASFNSIQNVFPLVKRVAQYNEEGKTITIYDEQDKGIAFEIADKEKTCTGIIVHGKGKKVTEVYLFLHPDMQLLNKDTSIAATR